MRHDLHSFKLMPCRLAAFLLIASCGPSERAEPHDPVPTHAEGAAPAKDPTDKPDAAPSHRSAPEQAAGPRQGSAIPAAFTGEWNQEPAACGTDLNDSRLRVEPGKLRFYESVAEVKSVTVHGPQAITVKAAFAGEVEVWTERFRMNLSPSGEELSVKGITRRRCPHGAGAAPASG